MSEENKNTNTGVALAPQASQHIIDKAKQEAYDFMNPERWAMIKQVAAVFYESKAIPKSIENAPQMVMVIQAGYEAGLQPIEALNSFYFVNGKISMYGEQGIALVRRKGHQIQWGKCNDETATCKITRSDTGESLEQTFTMEMARKRGLTNKGGAWVTAPDNMLKFKAFWAVARFLVPDAIHGLPMKEELETEMTVIDKENHKPISKKQKAEAIDHPPLDEALEATPVEEDTKPEPKRPKKEERDEIVSEESKPKKPESPAAKAMREGLEKGEFLAKNKNHYDELELKDLNGKIPLTDEEKEFMDKYESLKPKNKE